MTHLLCTHTHTHGIQHAGSGGADLKLRTTEDTNEAPQKRQPADPGKGPVNSAKTARLLPNGKR